MMKATIAALALTLATAVHAQEGEALRRAEIRLRFYEAENARLEAALQAAQQRISALERMATQPAPPTYAPIPMPQLQYAPAVPPQPVAPTLCTTQRIGNQLQTICR